MVGRLLSWTALLLREQYLMHRHGTTKALEAGLPQTSTPSSRPPPRPRRLARTTSSSLAVDRVLLADDLWVEELRERNESATMSVAVEQDVLVEEDVAQRATLSSPPTEMPGRCLCGRRGTSALCGDVRK